jgi:ABC-type Co2+ transport system permease subunit
MSFATSMMGLGLTLVAISISEGTVSGTVWSFLSSS